MKKSDLFFNIGIPVLFVGIIAIVVFKFIIQEQNPGLFAVRELSSISVVDLNNNKLNLMDLLDKDNETYCFLFELTNCYSCIYNGIEDLKKLKSSGSNCIAIAVHDLTDEVAGWSQNHDFSPFFVLKKIDFYKYFQCSTMPVLFSLKKGKVKAFRFITP
ncbi:MAG: hypothetical protein KAW12_28255 [Candidatus Aminicenantes bacterium]|nr:hypothetical protein [Candidatus Aminicenantes bacterium]